LVPFTKERKQLLTMDYEVDVSTEHYRPTGKVDHVRNKLLKCDMLCFQKDQKFEELDYCGVKTKHQEESDYGAVDDING